MKHTTKGRTGAGVPTSEAEEMERLRQELRRALRRSVREVTLAPDGGVDFDGSVAEYERGLITAALGSASGDIAEAARLLHLAPNTLRTKMKKLKIDPNESLPR